LPVGSPKIEVVGLPVGSPEIKAEEVVGSPENEDDGSEGDGGSLTWRR